MSMGHKTVIVAGKEYVIILCPPGIAEGAYWHDGSILAKPRRTNTMAKTDHINPPPDEPPAHMTVLEEMARNAGDLRSIMLEGDDDV